MPATTQIDFQMMEAELMRLRQELEERYRQEVTAGKITPFERDHRLNCNSALLSLIRRLYYFRKTSNETLHQLITRYNPQT